MTTQPRLSELIRKGAKMVDGQCQGDYIKRSKGTIRCCALGAAYYANTGKLPRHSSSDPNITGNLPMVNIDFEDIVFMNDTQGMTFEEIAADLEAKGL